MRPPALFGIGVCTTFQRARPSFPKEHPAASPAQSCRLRNDFGHAHYDGPEPPKGHGLHHYHFRVAALALNRLDLQAESTVAEVWEAARPSMTAEAELIGTYER